MARKVKVFDNFAGELQRRTPDSVLVEAKRFAAFGMSTRSAAVGRIGSFTHSLVYGVQTPHRLISYREDLFTAFQSEHGTMEAQERSNRIGSLLLAAEVRVEQLRLVLPGVDVQVGNGSGQPMPPELLEKLHVDMAEQGVVSPIENTLR